MNLLTAGLMFIVALIPLPHPDMQAPPPIYTTTVTTNIPAAIGCVWDSGCDVKCTSCRRAVCTNVSEYATVGACVQAIDITSWTVSGSPSSITPLTETGVLKAIWSGYTFQGVQSVSYQINTSGADDWAFPTEPLLPYQFGEPEERIDAPITAGILWEIARIALTAYNVVSGGDGATWLLFAGILLLPVAGMIVYRLLTSPPEI